MNQLSGKIFEAKSARDNADVHVGRSLKALRELAGLTQHTLAARLGVDQSSISRTEASSDVVVSILQRYVEALGATLRIDASFDGNRIAMITEAAFDREGAHEDQFVLPIIEDDVFPERRDVVFSIKRTYSHAIEIGLKTVELRRRFPINVPIGTVALIYSTSPTKALTGCAEIVEVVKAPPAEIWKKFGRAACIEKADFESYFQGLDNGFAIRLRGGRPLKRAVELPELRERFGFEPPQSFVYAKPRMRQALYHEHAQISD